MGRYKWLTSELANFKSDFIEAILLGLLISSIQIFSSLYVMAVYNKVLPNEALNSLFALFLGMIILFAFEFLFKLIKASILDDVCSRIDEVLSAKLFNKVVSWDLDSVPSQSGEVATLPKDLYNIIDLFANNNLTVVINLPFIIISFVIIYLIGGAVILVPLIIAFILGGISYYYFIKNIDVAESLKSASIKKSGYFVESVGNLELLKSIGSYDFFQTKWNEECAKEREATQRLRDVSRWQSSLQASVMSLSQILVVSFGAVLVVMSEMDSGSLIASVMLASRALQPVVQLSSVAHKISSAKISVERLTDVFDNESLEELRKKNSLHVTSSFVIKVSQVRYKPPGATLDALSIDKLTIPSKQKLGVVGSIGSGKSTLLRVLAGVVAPREGVISLGGKNYGSLNQKYMRGNLGYVGQFPTTFAGTIEENLLVGLPSVEGSKLSEILDITGMSAVLEKIPDGLNFRLSERGRELSGGQRQILSLARVLLMDPPVLLLDEPTSAMDPALENRFVGQLEVFSQNKTVVVVTHRKPILEMLDRIVVVEGGKIVMDGSREHVLSKFSKN